MTANLLTLETLQQRLELAPELGGGITRWDWRGPKGPTPLLRPWDGVADDCYTLACFPLTPWSNRISHGGFAQDGVLYPVAPNRAGEPYPIHGDGWLQAWRVTDSAPERIRLELESHHFRASPYAFHSTQTCELLPNGLAIDLSVTHLGDQPLPYGLGLHPYFTCDAQTRLRMRTRGIWLSGKDPLPVTHTSAFPPSADYNAPAPLSGPLLDHCYTGWDGEAIIEHPTHGLRLRLGTEDCNGYSLIYRPPGLGYFCLEPITHPIDAFHLPGRPGLVLLSQGATLRLRVSLTVSPLTGSDSLTS